MRPSEGQPIPGKDTLVNKARRWGHSIGDKLRISNNPQLATATEGTGSLSNPLDVEDPKKTGLFEQRKLRPLHATAGAGTAGTATKRDEETKPRRPMSRKVRYVLAGTVVAATILGGAGIAYETIPQVRTAINGIVGEGKVPLTYNPSQDKQLIGANNMELVTSDQAKQQGLLSPKIELDNDNNTVKITTLLAGTFLPQEIPTTTLDTTFHTREGDSLSPGDPRSRFASESRSLPKNFPITAPEGAHYAILKENDGSIMMVSVYYYDPISDVTITWTYGTDTGFSSSMPTTDRSSYRPYDPSFDFEKLPKSDGITTLVSTTRNQQPVDSTIGAVKGKFKSDSFLLPKDQLNVVFDHFTNVNQKLIGLSSR